MRQAQWYQNKIFVIIGSIVGGQIHFNWLCNAFTMKLMKEKPIKKTQIHNRNLSFFFPCMRETLSESH